MPQYILDVYGNKSFFDARDADEARKVIARKLGNEGVDEATIVGPSGQTWPIWHTHDEDGLAGWRYKDANGTVGKVYTNLAPRPGTLWAGGWHGIYDVKGLYLVAFDSSQFEDEDFALVGAVYYTLYDDQGRDVDGGWFGYNELTTWQDFLDFAGLNPRDLRLIVNGSDSRYYDIEEAIENGTFAKSESPKPRGSKPGSCRTPSGKGGARKKDGRKRNGRK